MSGIFSHAVHEKHKLSRSDNLKAATLAVEADEVGQHIKRLERSNELARGNGGGKIRIVPATPDAAPYDGRRAATLLTRRRRGQRPPLIRWDQSAA